VLIRSAAENRWRTYLRLPSATPPLARPSALAACNHRSNPAANRIAPQTGELYDYDAAGNLTRDKGGNSFGYDADNR
jgi:hypothetical protein